MIRAHTMLALLLVSPFLATAPALAADMGGNALVPGGASAARADNIRTGIGESRTQLFTAGGVSFGTLSDSAPSPSTLALPFASGRGNLAVGGYVTYGLSDTRLSSSLRGDGATMAADISASYAGSLLGYDGIAALRLGTAWIRQAQGFSPNPLQPGTAFADPYRGGGSGIGDVNLSFSLMHQVTPSFNFSGVAEAVRPSGADPNAAPGFMLGAGMGYRF